MKSAISAIREVCTPQFRHQVRRRALYGLMALVMALGIGLLTPQAGQASIFDLIFNGVQVLQLANMSDQQEVQLGRQINNSISRQVRIYRRDPDIVAYVNEIGQRLVPHSDRPGLPYTFQIVDDNSINAFATMGGFVYVHTGLIKAADNEAQLAGVMAHEIGHIGGRHAVNQMQEMAIAQGIVGALGVRQSLLVNLGVELALRLPNSREDEYDADRRGYHTVGKAGYATSGFTEFMKKLVSSSSVPSFLSTHPNSSDRVSRLEQMQANEPYPNANDGLDSAAYRNRIRGL